MKIILRRYLCLYVLLGVHINLVLAQDKSIVNDWTNWKYPLYVMDSLIYETLVTDNGEMWYDTTHFKVILLFEFDSSGKYELIKVDNMSKSLVGQNIVDRFVNELTNSPTFKLCFAKHWEMCHKFILTGKYTKYIEIGAGTLSLQEKEELKNTRVIYQE